MKRILTAEQLRAFEGQAVLHLEPGTVVTPSARDTARQMGLELRFSNKTNKEGSGNQQAAEPNPGELLNSERTGPEEFFPARRSASPEDNALIIAAFGRDQHGILAALAATIAQEGGNVQDVSQTILHGYFSIILSVEVDLQTTSFSAFKSAVQEIGQKLGLEVNIQKQVIFDAMHKV